jgi:hypothetical protein
VPEYLHQDPETEVRFIAGQYTIVGEKRIDYRDRELLCVVGIAEIGSSCCGTQGCRFVNIPGYVVAWKYRLSENGIPVTLVEPVECEAGQTEIRNILENLYPYSQILFSL